MGMYTKGEIFLISKTEEAAERFADEIRNLKSIENNVREVEFVGERDVVVYFDSGRYANAEYVLEEVERMAKEKFTSEDIDELTADLMTPENHLFLTETDFDSLEVSK